MTDPRLITRLCLTVHTTSSKKHAFPSHLKPSVERTTCRVCANRRPCYLGYVIAFLAVGMYNYNKMKAMKQKEQAVAKDRESGKADKEAAAEAGVGGGGGGGGGGGEAGKGGK